MNDGVWSLTNLEYSCDESEESRLTVREIVTISIQMMLVGDLDEIGLRRK